MNILDTLKSLGGNGAYTPSGNGLTGGTPPTMKNNFQLPNNGGSISVDPNAPTTPPTGFGPLNQPPEVGQQQASTQAMGPFATQQTQQSTQGTDITPEELAASMNEGLYGITNHEVPDANQVATMTPFDKYNMLRRQRSEDRNAGKGLYALDKNMAYSPDQVRQIYNSADDVYGKQMDELASQIQTSTGSKYGADSALSGLSPNAVSLVYKMSDDFNSSPIVKNFNVIQNSNLAAQGVMKSIASRPDKKATAGDDMTLMYLFAKAQDPNSVVRESEYANVADYFSSLPQNVQFQLSRVYKNTPDGRLTDESRKNVVRGLDTLYTSNKQQYDQFKSSKASQINNIAGKPVANYFIDTYENVGNGASGSGVLDNEGFASSWK